MNRTSALLLWLLPLGTALLLLAGTATALPVTGPVYPPSGGVTWAPSGAANAGFAPGLDWNYSAFNNAAFVELYWGPLNPQGGLDGTLNAMTFTGISGTVATWQTPTSYTSPGGPGAPPSGTYTMRLQVDVSGLGANPWVLEASVSGLTAAAPGIGAVIDNSTGLDYTANLLFTAYVGGSWTPINDIPQSPGSLTQSSVGGGFFEVVPEPGTAVLFGLGLAGLGSARRRRG